jgi:septum formation protein
MIALPEPISQKTKGGIILNYPLILASGSPRRKELLESLGLDFKTIVSDVDEGAFNLDHLSPGDFVAFLARTKAQEVFKHHRDSYVVGADTVVVLEGKIYGKPVDEADACRMLSELQGRSHEVYTGICIFNPDPADSAKPFICEWRRTEVWMRPMNTETIQRYVQAGEPMDKAGAYAIQGQGATLIEKINGCYFNVVGLSVNHLTSILESFGEKL